MVCFDWVYAQTNRERERERELGGKERRGEERGGEMGVNGLG